MSSGRVLNANGEHGRATEMMREAIEAYRATGQRIGLPLMLAALAEAHAAAGATAAALACVAEGRTVAESSGEVCFLAELHRLEGTLHAAAGVRRTDGKDLARLVGSFTEGADLPDVRDARHIVAELRGDRA
jgi:predicted ATPase